LYDLFDITIAHILYLKKPVNINVGR